MDISRVNNYKNKYHCSHSEVSFIINRYWLLIVAYTVERLSDTTDLEEKVLTRYTSGDGHYHDNRHGPSISSMKGQRFKLDQIRTGSRQPQCVIRGVTGLSCRYGEGIVPTGCQIILTTDNLVAVTINFSLFTNE